MYSTPDRRTRGSTEPYLDKVIMNSKDIMKATDADGSIADSMQAAWHHTLI